MSKMELSLVDLLPNAGDVGETVPGNKPQITNNKCAWRNNRRQGTAVLMDKGWRTGGSGQGV